MSSRTIKSAFLSVMVVTTASLFSTVTCYVPDLTQYIPENIVIVTDGDRGHHHDHDSFFSFDWWNSDDCCW